jgi:hypothetical protein
MSVVLSNLQLSDTDFEEALTNRALQKASDLFYNGATWQTLRSELSSHELARVCWHFLDFTRIDTGAARGIDTNFDEFEIIE